MKKRILSFLMALLMMVSIIPFNIFAESEPEPTPPEVEGTSEPTTEPVTDPPCDTCGAYDCGSEHLTWCADCRMDDCGKTHVFCEICQKNDCGQNHCPTCGTIDCTADHGAPAAETPEEPEVHPMVGKVVKTTSFSFGTAFGDPTNAATGKAVGSTYYPALLVITNVTVVGSTTYYQLSAGPDCSWPQVAIDAELTDGFWLEAAKLVEATWCADCKEYECGTDHTQPTDPTDPPVAPEVPELDDRESGIVLKGTFPADVSLTVEPADVSGQLSQFGVSGEKLVFGLDISLMRSGADYQPGAAVRVKVPVSAAAGTMIGILHTHGGETTYMGLTEVQSDGTVEFTTDRFSTFAGFTVDFHYNEIDYSIAGLTSIKLSELFVALEIDRNAAHVIDVTYSDPSQIKVTQIDGDWQLESLKAFVTEETLEITFYDGEIIAIDVTDWQYDYDTTNGEEYDVGYLNTDGQANWTLHINRDNLPMTIYLTRTVGSLGWNYPSGSQYISTSESNRRLTVKLASYIPLGHNIVNIDATVGGRVYIDFFENISVTYNSGGVVTTSMPSGTTEKTYGTITISSTRPTADGYTFTNWLGSDGKYYNPGATVTVDGDVSFTAQWSPISYSVSFNGNGATGGSMSNQSFKFGTAQNLTANAYKREYTVTYNTNGGNAIAAATAKATFNGWEDRGSIVYKGTTYSYTTFDAPFYANKYGDLMNAFGYNKYNLLNHWVTYTVNGSETRIARGDAPGLYPNGASVSNLATTNGYTVPLYADWILGSVTLPTPTKAGYTFTGWSDGSNTYASGATYTPTANVTLTALWEKSGYTVTWKNWDGEVLETDENVAAGTTPEYNGQTPVREGNAQYSYTFDKWSPAIAAVTGDATYTATYTATPVPYTVTWVYGNGTENKVETVAYGAAITKPTDPTRTGYNFTGWSPEVPATMPAEDQTFTAQWEGKKYTLTVYATYGQPNTHSEYEVQYGTDLNNNLRSVITTPAGFGLKGLYTQTNSGGTRVYDANAKWLTGTDYWDDAGHWKYDGNLTVYADWESIEYTITYVDTLDNTTTTAKYTTYLPAYYLEGRSREGYNFDGWKVKETAGHWTAGSIHLAGASCVGLYGDVTLETVWTPIEYTITYELNGGTLAEGVSNPEKYTIETQTFTLYNPIKPGYKFKGWATSADATTGTETVTIEEGTIGEKAFYALWERSLVDLTITATTSDRDQNFIFTVSGTRSDGVAFESIDVVLCNENGFQVTIKDMPVGQYTVAEKNNWSWRESDVGSQNADLRTEGKTVSFGFGSVDDLHWLSDYSYRKKGGS